MLQITAQCTQSKMMRWKKVKSNNHKFELGYKSETILGPKKPKMNQNWTKSELKWFLVRRNKKGQYWVKVDQSGLKLT